MDLTRLALTLCPIIVSLGFAASLVIIGIVDSRERLIRHYDPSKRLIPEVRVRSEIPSDPRLLLSTFILSAVLSFIPLFLVIVLHVGDEDTR